MIVICTKCQAKFRVADEKVGPRGAKVRCSRCQNVFHVLQERPAAPAGVPAALPPPLGPARRAMDVELENPFAGAAGASPPVPPAPPPESDPFAHPGFGMPLEARLPPDPFASAPESADPFAPAARSTDPFAPGASEPDPFAPAAGPSGAQGEASRLALTDLSDLLGTPTPHEVPQPEGGAGPSELGEPPVGPSEPGDAGGLALEDRLTPPPLPARSVLDGGDAPSVVPGVEPFLSEPQAFGSFELGAAGGDLALASEAPEPLPAPAPVLASSGLELAEPPPPPSRPAPAAVAALAEDRMARPRPSRLRAVVVNAIALAALVLGAVVMLVVWREGSFAAASFRPSAVLAALGGGEADGPFAAVDVHGGVYERAKGPPLLFVRGKVVSRAASAVAAVKVTVEVVRADAVVARGEALAGAIPTAEELYHATDDAALAAVARAAGGRAPARIQPGDAVPFLVAIAEHPGELEGATVRVALAQAKGAAR